MPKATHSAAAVTFDFPGEVKILWTRKIGFQPWHIDVLRPGHRIYAYSANKNPTVASSSKILSGNIKQYPD